MTRPHDRGRISRRERLARAALGMAEGHPEFITRKPGRTEWRQLAAWCAQLWPADEYTAITVQTGQQDEPPPPERR